MATKCKACGGQARKGSGGIASVLVDGKVVSGRVCGTCLGKAVVLVVAPVAPCGCGGKASKCSACVAKVVDGAKRGAADAKKLAKALRDRAKAYAMARKGKPVLIEHEDGFADGLEAGLDQAANFLEKGAW